jgi:hypothetical protein
VRDEGGNDEKSKKAKTRKKITSMKTKIISKLLFTLGLAFVLVSAITEVHGGIVTIQSTGNVSRGQTGSFGLFMAPPIGGTYVNFSVGGTAIPGADYFPLISPAYMVPLPNCVPPPTQFCPRYAVIPVKTLPDPRGSFSPQAYSVVVTLEPGPGYTIGEPSSAQLMINP